MANRFADLISKIRRTMGGARHALSLAEVSGSQLGATSTGRTPFTARQTELLISSLAGNRPEQPVWSNQDFREHALRSLMKYFGDDWNWCSHAASALYFLNPSSVGQIDHIIEEHVESRFGTFASELYAGRGWNPADVLTFNGDTDKFWRCYMSYAEGQWYSAERRHPGELPSWDSSGYGFRGTRGCVRSLAISHTVDIGNVSGYIETFVLAAENLVSNACGDFGRDDLCHAIRNLAAYDERVSSVRIQFNVGSPQPDPGENPKRAFSLMLDYD